MFPARARPSPPVPTADLAARLQEYWHRRDQSRLLRPERWPFESAEDEREAACLGGRPLWGPDL